MKCLIIASIISMVFARPDGLFHENDGHVSVTQSSAGTYKYTVHLKDSTRAEERLADGTVVGEYSVPDANGVLRTIKYTSGRDGFRILESDLPGTVVENSDLNGPLVKSGEAPLAGNTALPVEDTPEVKAAKEEFFTVYRAAAAMAA